MVAQGDSFQIIGRNTRVDETSLRADLVLANKDQAYIADATVTFDVNYSQYSSDYTLYLTKNCPVRNF